MIQSTEACHRISGLRIFCDKKVRFYLMLFSLPGRKDLLKVVLIALALFMVLLAATGILLLKHLRDKNAARQRNLSMIYATQNLTINQYNDDRNSQNA